MLWAIPASAVIGIAHVRSPMMKRAIVERRWLPLRVCDRKADTMDTACHDAGVDTSRPLATRHVEAALSTCVATPRGMRSRQFGA